MGVNSPCESERAANVVLVEKKVKTQRTVVEECHLNFVAVKDSDSMGNIENLLDCLNGSKFLTGSDLFSGHYAILKAEEDMHQSVS